MYMNYNNEMNEGAISTEDVAKKVFFVIKDIISYYGKENRGKRFSESEVGEYVNQVNDNIKRYTYDIKISPCIIRFDKIDAYGIYHKEDKDIKLSRDHYLLKKVFNGEYEFRMLRDIKLDAMYNTIEHELIHQRQDELSKGEFLKDRVYTSFVKKYIKGDGIDIDGVFKKIMENPKLLDVYNMMLKKYLRSKYGDIIDRKKEIAPDDSNEDFIKNVLYYNSSSELNTFAKEAVDKYIKNAIKGLKTDITFDSKYSNGKRYSRMEQLSSEDVKRIILPFLKSDKDRYEISKYDFINKITRDYIGYKYLTVENRKKWWRYVFQLLMNHKFEPIVIKKRQ